jgi:hypothetical protein
LAEGVDPACYRLYLLTQGPKSKKEVTQEAKSKKEVTQEAKSKKEVTHRTQEAKSYTKGGGSESMLKLNPFV